MSEFKDKIPAAGATVEFIYDAARGGIANRISGTGFRAMYLVAVSLDGQHLLDSVVPAGLGGTMVYPQPSVLAFVQSDDQGMWGRNCPYCQKYFRTTHIMGTTYCPYCSEAAPDLAFISNQQRTYLTAFYEAFARAHLEKRNTTLNMADITDQTAAWHYSEEKQQFHFTCQTEDCHTQTDILGEVGYCPRCGRTNARSLFSAFVDKELDRVEQVRKSVPDRHEREAVWEKMIGDALSRFEALARHLRQKLMCYPMTASRRKQLEQLSFQRPLAADALLEEWFGIGVLEWSGNSTNPKRQVDTGEVPFIKKMIQRRHILIHNGGLVDQEYLDQSGDADVQLGERIRVSSKDAKRFLKNVREMGMNLLDNVEEGFSLR
jgi:hypothetical protein